MLNKKKILIKRLFIWLFYLFSGFTLYTQKTYLYPALVSFTQLVYPLSIFWVQIRIKKRSNFLPIDSSMSTSQLWFNILPVLASIFAVILTSTNAIIFLINKFISF